MVDFETPIGVVSYEGPGCYRFEVEPTAEGDHLFAVTSESADQVQSAPARSSLQIHSNSIAMPQLLAVEVV